MGVTWTGTSRHLFPPSPSHRSRWMSSTWKRRPRRTAMSTAAARTNEAATSTICPDDAEDVAVVAKDHVRVPGGPSFSAAAAGDVGGNDEVHGKNGDDFIYGGKGSLSSPGGAAAVFDGRWCMTE